MTRTNKRKPLKNFSRRAALFVLTTLLLGGCTVQDNGASKADIFEASLQQKFPVIEAMPGQKSLYDRAYDNAKNYFTPEEPVRGAVTAASLKSKEELAGFFKRLEKNQHYRTVVLLTPLHTSATNRMARIGGVQPAGAIGDFTYKTAYGLLSPPADLLKKIEIGQLLKLDEAAVKKEAWPSVYAPFIARSFHDVSYLPLLVDEAAPEPQLQQLSQWLNDNLPADALVLAQVSPKTSPDPDVAEFQLEFTKNVLENFDETKLSTLPLNGSATLEVLEKYLAARHAEHLQNQFMDPQTGNFISFASDGPLYQSRSVFMVAFGDLMFDRLVRALMDSHSLDYPFEKMDLTYLQSNDILVANLEGPIAKKRVKTSKEIAFRFAPDIVPLLKKYFFDALSQANNHARDMGQAGLDDTFDLLAPTGIKVFGDPGQINDRTVTTLDVDGQKIAFIGLEEVVYKIDDAKAVAKIQELTAQGYKVIPFLHWGIEYQHKPNARQQQLAHEFIDAGAVAVIGCHPHVVETYETYKNRPIFYSLGNAIFDQYFSPDTQEGLSVAMNIASDQIEIYFLPIKIDRSQFRLMTREERASFLQRFVSYGDYASEAERQDILNGKLVIKLK